MDFTNEQREDFFLTSSSLFGLTVGTFRVQGGRVIYNVIETALKTGYRSIGQYLFLSECFSQKCF